MSYPTVQSPWYVVYSLKNNGKELFYRSPVDEEESKEIFTPTRALAMMFMSLHVAAKVARATGAQIRVLTSEDEAKEFGRSQ